MLNPLGENCQDISKGVRNPARLQLQSIAHLLIHQSHISDDNLRPPPAGRGDSYCLRSDRAPQHQLHGHQQRGLHQDPSSSALRSLGAYYSLSREAGQGRRHLGASVKVSECIYFSLHPHTFQVLFHCNCRWLTLRTSIKTSAVLSSAYFFHSFPTRKSRPWVSSITANWSKPSQPH